MYWVCVQWSVVDGKQNRNIATHTYEHQIQDHGSAREERILLRAGLRHRCSPMGLTTTSQEGLTPPSSPHGDAPARASIHDPIPPPSIFLKNKHCHSTNQHSLTQLSLATVAAQVARLAASSQLSGEASCCCVACAAAKQEHRRRPENQPPKLTIRLSDK